MDKTLLQGLITAHLFMENGDLAGAKRILTTLPPEYYDDPRQLLMLARVVCLEVQEPEDFAEAITIFRQVARAGSWDASILVNVAALALKIGYRDSNHAARERVADHRLALDAVRQAIAVEPELPVSYLIAARLIINLTLYESGGAELESLEAEAKAHLGQAETVGADPASVATLRVALMLVLGQLDAAREFLTDPHPQTPGRGGVAGLPGGIGPAAHRSGPCRHGANVGGAAGIPGVVSPLHGAHGPVRE